ncbi:MAG: FkbM family methyltransferase [Rhizobiaceae bacterium]
MSGFSMRGMAERIARGRSFWRRLPPEFGNAPLRVSPDAALKVLKPGHQAFDPMLLRLCDEYVKPGDVVWDIGANLGIFALAAAQRGGDVLAIEPDGWLHALLVRTQQHSENQKLHLELLCAAISAEPGTAQLAIAQRGRASNFLMDFDGRTQTGGVRQTNLVPVLTLDTLMRGHSRPSLIKIDVEGAEFSVLKGADQLLSESRPTILIEVGDATRDDVVKLLEHANYHLSDYQLESGSGVVSMASSNLLAKPR